MHCAQPLTQSLDPRGTVRASVGCYTTNDEADALVRAVGEIAREKATA
jgi:selenocysteine lyase/cysteine desulfurase